jgi:hypothetical protein
MKTKDIVSLVIALVIFLIAGYVAYTQLLSNPSSSKQEVKVEVVGAITEEFDSAALTMLRNPDKVRDYTVPLDLQTGLGNSAVFGQ